MGEVFKKYLNEDSKQNLSKYNTIEGYMDIVKERYQYDMKQAKIAKKLRNQIVNDMDVDYVGFKRVGNAHFIVIKANDIDKNKVKFKGEYIDIRSLCKIYKEIDLSDEFIIHDELKRAYPDGNITLRLHY